MTSLMEGRNKNVYVTFMHSVYLFSTFIFQWCSFFMSHVGDAWKIWMDCLELWLQITILWKWRYRPFSKVSSVCQCVPGDFYKKRTSELSQMWLSSYERCGIPCSHILKITDEIEATMIKIQHWKVFHVHFGLAESKISPKLMKGISIQLIDKDMGVPISDESLLKANSPETYRCVN